MSGSIHEFCSEFHISLSKARRMEKRGWLRITSDTQPIDEIRLTLKRGHKLTVAQLLELVENPSGLLELRNYAGAAEMQLAKLGDVKAQIAPREIAAHILDAYKNDSEAVGVVASWIASVIPSGEAVGHAWVACRLLLGVPEANRKHDITRMQRALMNVRAHGSMANQWFTVHENSRNVTYYQKRPLDL